MWWIKNCVDFKPLFVDAPRFLGWRISAATSAAWRFNSGLSPPPYRNIQTPRTSLQRPHHAPPPGSYHGSCNNKRIVVMCIMQQLYGFGASRSREKNDNDDVISGMHLERRTMTSLHRRRKVAKRALCCPLSLNHTHPKRQSRYGFYTYYSTRTFRAFLGCSKVFGG